jgi:hypothetical protein
MKKVFAALAATAIAATAQAGSLNLDMRFDHKNGSFNDDAAKQGYSSFTMHTGRFDYKGKVSETLSFRTRVRFNKTPATVNKTDSLNSTVDYAYVTQKMNDSFSLTMGKFASDIGGFEGATSGADIYLLSDAYAGTNAFGTATSVGAYSNYLYTSGVKGAYVMGDHSVSLMAFNPAEDSVSNGVNSGNFNNSRYGVGLVYSGSFMEKALTVKASMHNVALMAAADAKVSYTAVGAMYSMDVVKFGFDYLMNAQTKEVSGTAKDPSTTSMIATVSYTGMEGMTPSLKVFQTADKNGATTEVKNDVTGISGSVEFTPVKEEAFRYHVAYNTISSKLDSAGAKTKSASEVIAGIRINADFLK